MTGRVLLVASLAFAALALGASHAADYTDDDLCRAIGETPRDARQPRDRLFLEKKCLCYEGGCAATGSARSQALAQAQKDALALREREKAEAEAEQSKMELERQRAAAAAAAQEAAQREARARLECVQYVNTNVRYQGPPPPEGTNVRGMYVAPSPLAYAAYQLAQKRFRDQQQQVFETCMQAKTANQ